MAPALMKLLNLKSEEKNVFRGVIKSVLILTIYFYFFIFLCKCNY